MQLTDKKKIPNNKLPRFKKRTHSLHISTWTKSFQRFFPSQLFNKKNNPPVTSMLSATKIQTGLTLHNWFTTKIPIVKRQTFHFGGQVQHIMARTVCICSVLTPLQPAFPGLAAPQEHQWLPYARRILSSMLHVLPELGSVLQITPH